MGEKPSKKKTILITAGPTIEPIDPVRYISNHSTGTMGFELAKKALKRGYKVVLVSGPTCLKPPKAAEYLAVKTAVEMKAAVMRHYRSADCVFMTAAVSDFRPVLASKRKIKKLGRPVFLLRLRKNPDILTELGKHKAAKLLIGFCLETEDLLRNALNKLYSKKLDFIVAGKAGRGVSAFGRGGKDVFIIDRFGGQSRHKDISKARLADILLDKAEAMW